MGYTTTEVTAPKVAPTVKPNPMQWEKILREAVTVPGLMHDAYRAFWPYSRGNQIAAIMQCTAREIEVGPLDTFAGWLNKGRKIKKGERGLQLCQPVETRAKSDAQGAETTEASETERNAAGVVVRRFFIWRPHWFTYSQTEGEPMLTPEPPALAWDKAKAFGVLGISQVPFSHPDGNCQGFAGMRDGRAVLAVNPVAALPHKTLFHEIAHHVLGHVTGETFADGETITRDLRELEAESVAYILCESFGLAGADYSRGYIQHWFKGEQVPEKSARRIFGAADKIIKAGEPIA
jgi:hypothetical protein